MRLQEVCIRPYGDSGRLQRLESSKGTDLEIQVDMVPTQ
jgi:hypothetical protein